jgi:pilus assembly protein Flp/PilA
MPAERFARCCKTRKIKRRKTDMMKHFLVEEEGQTLVEYGLLVSLIALVVIAVLTIFGKKVSTVFNTANDSLQIATN